MKSDKNQTDAETGRTTAPYPGPFPWPPEKAAEYARKYTRDIQIKGHYFSRISVGLLSGIIRALSPNGAWRFGAAIGSLMAALKIRRETVMVNLDIVYKDNPKTEEEKQAIYKGCMINLVRQMVNYFRIPDMTDKFWRENVTFSNEEAIKAAYNKGKGVIIIAMHYGAWEVPGGKFGMSGYPASNIVKVLKNPVIDKVLIDARLSMNFGTIPHKNSMKRIIEGLARGEGIVMAVDQNMKRSVGVMAKWFGHPASTIRSCAYLARETGAAVVAGYGTQDTPDKIEINVMGEMPWVSDPDPDKELLINTQNYISALEKPIYDAPEGWLWLHRRWKVQPEGMPNPYKEPKAKS